MSKAPTVQIEPGDRVWPSDMSISAPLVVASISPDGQSAVLTNELGNSPLVFRRDGFGQWAYNMGSDASRGDWIPYVAYIDSRATIIRCGKRLQGDD